MRDFLEAVLFGNGVAPDAPALTDPQGRTLTHAEFGERIRSVATGLRAHGMVAGDTMLFSIRPSVAGISLALGTVAAGGTIAFIDPGTSRELFAARLALAAPTWAAAESLLYAIGRLGPGSILARRRGLTLPDLAGLQVRHIHAGAWLPGVPRSALSLRRLLSTSPDDLPAGDLNQAAVIVFTSGTTADPKAVVHTRSSLGAALKSAAAPLAFSQQDELFTDQLFLGLPALAAGAHWRLPPFGLSPRADPGTFAGLIGDASVVFAVPPDLTVVADAVAASTAPRPPRLRTVVTGGAPVTKALVRKAASIVEPAQLLALYGMTEMLPITATTGADILAFDGVGSLVGTALPGVQLRIADDTELLASGSGLCRGYLGRDPLGELATGDLARVDEGVLILLGRKKDMLIRGTTNIYPSLYEPAIAGLPGVGDAAIVGVPDGFGDERVVLFVVPTPGDADSGTAIGDSHPLATIIPGLLPDVIDAAALPDQTIVLGALPRSGRQLKLDRDALRALAVAGSAVPLPENDSP